MSDISLKDKTAIITGASRGIGKAIALKLAENGVNVVVAAKTIRSSQKTPGTIHDTVAEIEALGAKGLAVKTDVRNESDIEHLVAKTLERFGRIDILVNNAGAILWKPVEELPVGRFDLMMQINTRAPFLLCHYALPYLKQQPQAHIINMSPPLRMGDLATDKWNGRTAYLISKFGMTHLTIGLAEEVREHNIAVNSLWPNSIIDSQATRVFAAMFGAGETVPWYSAEMVAEACLQIVRTSPARLTGQTLVVEEFLTETGFSNPEQYRVPCPI